MGKSCGPSILFQEWLVRFSVTQLFAMCGIAGALALCFWRDIHGPPTILGILLAGIMTISEVANRERASLRSQLTKET